MQMQKMRIKRGRWYYFFGIIDAIRVFCWENIYVFGRKYLNNLKALFGCFVEINKINNQKLSNPRIYKYDSFGLFLN
jgi:hypothetical protein